MSNDAGSRFFSFWTIVALAVLVPVVIQACLRFALVFVDDKSAFSKRASDFVVAFLIAGSCLAIAYYGRRKFGRNGSATPTTANTFSRVYWILGICALGSVNVIVDLWPSRLSIALIMVNIGGLLLIKIFEMRNKEKPEK